MKLLQRAKNLLKRENSNDGDYICVNCGESFDRDFRECPDCGGPYIASAGE